jgi:hypothetical protein
LKALSGLTPYEFVCKRWTSKPDRFILDPIHQMPGPNILGGGGASAHQPASDDMDDAADHPPIIYARHA